MAEKRKSVADADAGDEHVDRDNVPVFMRQEVTIPVGKHIMPTSILSDILAQREATACSVCGGLKHGPECPHCASVSNEGDVTPIANDKDTLSNLEGGGSLTEALAKCGDEVTVTGQWRTGYSTIPKFEGVTCPTTAGVVMAARKSGYGVVEIGTDVKLRRKK